MEKLQKRIRPETLEGETIKVLTGFGNLYITLNKDLEGNLFEVFCTIGKSGLSTNAKSEVTGRLISLALKYGIPPKEIANQLIGISGEHPQFHGNRKVLSIPDAVGQIMKERLGL